MTLKEFIVIRDPRLPFLGGVMESRDNIKDGDAWRKAQEIAYRLVNDYKQLMV